MRAALDLRLGWLAPLTLLAVCAAVAVGAANGASRGGETWGGPVFWLAIFACAVPFAFRLAGSGATHSERLSLVIVFGLWLFLVKLLRDPNGFTYADELVHSYNVDRIVSTHRLFSPNAILSLTPRYPGLETTTAILHFVGGASIFCAGVILISLARVLLVLALFHFFECIGASARTAGLATLLYMANPNFVFFDAQFSYESLALPIAVFAVCAIAQWAMLRQRDLTTEQPDPLRVRQRHGWALVAIASILAVVVTHHVSSYVLVIFIFAVARFQREIDRGVRSTVTPYRFGVFALLATLTWLVVLAQPTWNYLAPNIAAAVRSVLDILGGHQGTRQLFSGAGGTEEATPTWDRLVAVSAALLIASGIPFGLWRIWKHHRANAAYLVLGAAGAAYFLALFLRFVPAAWEIANRSSEFLFIGVGFVLALAGLERWRPRIAPQLGCLAFALAFGVLVEGGVVAGWSSNLVLAKTFAVKAGTATLRPEGVTAANWARHVLGPDRRFAADPANARLLAALGSEFAIQGTNPDVQAVIREPKVDGWHVRLLHKYRLPYVLVDRRRISEDALAGYFFATNATPSVWRDTFDAQSVHKFDRQPAVSRIYDSGEIVIYDVQRLRDDRIR